MPTRLTNVVATEPFSIPNAATAVRFDHFTLRDFLGPIILFDHLHLYRAGFPPHPHAGLCVFSYLFDDSAGTLRDRDSLNREILVRPGDLLWFQMASGMIHEENPEQDGQPVEQLQVWVNLSRDKHDLPPATFHLRSAEVPVVDAAGRVRVVLGSYGGAQSPLVPTEPFTLLDMRVEGDLDLPVPDGWSGIVYCRVGSLRITSGENETATLHQGEVVGVRPGTTIVLRGDNGPAAAVFMARPLLDQPLVVQGMFAMADQDELDQAKRRFHQGDFGHVEPYPRVLHPGEPYVPAGQDPAVTTIVVVERQATLRHYDAGWWQLHLQYCRYEYSDYETAYGYRFVWEDPDGRAVPYRYAGYIPYLDYVGELVAIADREGWGNIPYRDSF